MVEKLPLRQYSKLLTLTLGSALITKLEGCQAAVGKGY